jgi:hypothetical protein
MYLDHWPRRFAVHLGDGRKISLISLEWGILNRIAMGQRVLSDTDYAQLVLLQFQQSGLITGEAGCWRATQVAIDALAAFRAHGAEPAVLAWMDEDAWVQSPSMQDIGEGIFLRNWDAWDEMEGISPPRILWDFPPDAQYSDEYLFWRRFDHTNIATEASSGPSASHNPSLVFRELQVVRLSRNLCFDGEVIPKGSKATILQIFEHGRAYEVEFEGPHEVPETVPAQYLEA